MKLTSLVALLSTASSCCSSFTSAFVVDVRPSSSSTTIKQRTSQLMQQYYGGEEENNYYGNDDQSQYYDQQQQNQQEQYYDEQQQQQYNQYDQGVNPTEDEPTLLISDNMQQEMQRATANTDMGGIDYLALARQRAAARVQSVNGQSTDADWHALAEEKRVESGGYVNEDEAWESSLDDEGSESDVNSLGMGVGLVEGEGGVMMTEGGLVVDSIDEGDEPQLLL